MNAKGYQALRARNQPLRRQSAATFCLLVLFSTPLPRRKRGPPQLGCGFPDNCGFLLCGALFSRASTGQPVLPSGESVPGDRQPA